MNLRQFAAAALPAVLAACTAAPRETLVLSEVVGEQIAELQASHESFASLYYAKLRDQADRFLTEVWTPSFLARAVQNSAVQEDLRTIFEGTEIDLDALASRIDGLAGFTALEKDVMRQSLEQARTRSFAEFGDLMLAFSEEAMRQIALQRAAMIEPIDEQERMVITRLRESWADLQRGQATIEAYLGSVVELREEQDAVLGKLGLLQARQGFVDTAIGLSESASNGLASAEDADAATQLFLESLEQLRNAFQSSGR